MFKMISDLCAGGSDDWAKDVGKATYSYTVELQDQGRYGFALPASRIHRVSDHLMYSHFSCSYIIFIFI